MRPGGVVHFNNNRVRYPFVARTRIGSLVLSGMLREQHYVGSFATFPREGCDKWAFETQAQRDAFREVFAGVIVKADA